MLSKTIQLFHFKSISESQTVKIITKQNITQLIETDKEYVLD